MAESYDVAHIRVQGQKVILVVVPSAFGRMTQEEQSDAYDVLQGCATSAGLAGTVAVVWFTGARLMTYGPTEWRGYLRSLTPAYVRQNINRKLTCGL